MSNFYSISIFCVLNRLFLCNHVKREWNWQPRHRPDRTFRVNKSHVLIFFFFFLLSKSNLLISFFNSYFSMFLLLLSFWAELMITISDYNWCVRGANETFIYYIWRDCRVLSFSLILFVCLVLKSVLSKWKWEPLESTNHTFVAYANEIVCSTSNVMRKFNNILPAQTFLVYLYGLNWIINICPKNWRDMKRRIKKTRHCIWVGLSFLKKCAFKGHSQSNIWWLNSKNWQCSWTHYSWTYTTY